MEFAFSRELPTDINWMTPRDWERLENDLKRERAALSSSIQTEHDAEMLLAIDEVLTKLGAGGSEVIERGAVEVDGQGVPVLNEAFDGAYANSLCAMITAATPTQAAS